MKKKKITLLFFTIFTVTTQILSICEEQEHIEKVTGRDTWRYINIIDGEKYVHQQKELLNSGTLKVSALLYNSENDGYLKKIAEIFQVITKSELLLPSENLLQSFSLGSQSLSGYHHQDIYLTLSGQNNSCIKGITIIPEKWSEKLDISPIMNNFVSTNSGKIRIHISINETSEIAGISLIRHIIEGNKHPADYLTLYKIDKGPGDACLVQVEGGNAFSIVRNNRLNFTLNDRRVAFVRYNVTVYLTSSYKNFGCMDLACRLDALIVEQMKKQQEQEKNKREGTNQ
jgi:hypothetical protein